MASAPRIAIALAILAALVGDARPARACAACGCGDPTLTAMGVEKPFRNRVRLSLDEMFGGHSLGTGTPFEEDSWTLRSTLTGSWSPLDWLTIAASLPLVSSWVQYTGRGWQNITGLGDAELMVRALPLRLPSFSPRHLIGVLVGLKFPTGPRIVDDQGYPYPEDDQPGSGSFDPFGGASYSWFGDEIALFASATFRYTTTGRRDYRHGSSVGATAGVQFQPWTWGAGSLSADFRWAAADTLPSGADAPDTGGAMLSLTPSILVQPLTDWLIRLSVQIHVGEWLNGNQSETYAVLLSTVVDL